MIRSIQIKNLKFFKTQVESLKIKKLKNQKALDQKTDR